MHKERFFLFFKLLFALPVIVICAAFIYANNPAAPGVLLFSFVYAFLVLLFVDKGLALIALSASKSTYSSRKFNLILSKTTISIVQIDSGNGTNGFKESFDMPLVDLEYCFYEPKRLGVEIITFFGGGKHFSLSTECCPSLVDELKLKMLSKEKCYKYKSF